MYIFNVSSRRYLLCKPWHICPGLDEPSSILKLALFLASCVHEFLELLPQLILFLLLTLYLLTELVEQSLGAGRNNWSQEIMVFRLCEGCWEFCCESSPKLIVSAENCNWVEAGIAAIAFWSCFNSFGAYIVRILRAKLWIASRSLPMYKISKLPM